MFKFFGGAENPTLVAGLFKGKLSNARPRESTEKIG
jgi:hypothetical protein